MKSFLFSLLLTVILIAITHAKKSSPVPITEHEFESLDKDSEEECASRIRWSLDAIGIDYSPEDDCKKLNIKRDAQF